MIAAALIVLALLDAMFAGFRDAAGRNALIHKDRYKLRAMKLGVAVGVVAVVIIAGPVLACLAWSPDPEQLYRDLNVAGTSMLLVYLPYGTVAILALLLYLLPKPEISSLTTVIVLGPFTMIRPLVIVVGAVMGAITVPRAEVFLLVTLSAIVMGLFEKSLGWIGINPRDLDEQIALDRVLRTER